MKISEIIAELEKVKHEHGDLRVIVTAFENYAHPTVRANQGWANMLVECDTLGGGYDREKWAHISAHVV